MLCNDRKCRHQRTNNKQAHYTCGNFWSLPARSAVPTQSDKAHGFWMQISPSKYFYLNKFPRFQDFCGFNIISAANLWPWGEKNHHSESMVVWGNKRWVCHHKTTKEFFLEFYFGRYLLYIHLNVNFMWKCQILLGQSHIWVQQWLV